MTAAASSAGWDARNAAQIPSLTVAMGYGEKVECTGGNSGRSDFSLTRQENSPLRIYFPLMADGVGVYL